MNKLVAFLVVLTASLMAGCATTEYKSFEGKVNVFEGKGGTKVVIDGMELWDNGEPPVSSRCSASLMMNVQEDSFPWHSFEVIW